jgi:glutathione S-transferase
MTSPPVSDKRTLWGVGTSRTLRAHWALIELGLPYRKEPIQSRTGETQTAAYGAVNPRRKIPTLQDGDLTLSESAAIVAYLAERYRTSEISLAPRDIGDRARYFEWQSFICMELDATSLYIMRRHEYLPDVYGAAPAAVTGARDYFSRMINAAENTFDDGRPFLLSEDFSGVDILMMTVLDWAVRYGLALPAPFIAYQSRIAARPGYVAALQANQAP